MEGGWSSGKRLRVVHSKSLAYFKYASRESPNGEKGGLLALGHAVHPIQMGESMVCAPVREQGGESSGRVFSGGFQVCTRSVR